MPSVQDGIPAEPDGAELAACEFGPHLRELRRVLPADYASVAIETLHRSRWNESVGAARWLADLMATIDQRRPYLRSLSRRVVRGGRARARAALRL